MRTKSGVRVRILRCVLTGNRGVTAAALLILRQVLRAIGQNSAEGSL